MQRTACIIKAVHHRGINTKAAKLATLLLKTLHQRLATYIARNECLLVPI